MSWSKPQGWRRDADHVPVPRGTAESPFSVRKGPILKMGKLRFKETRWAFLLQKSSCFSCFPYCRATFLEQADRGDLGPCVVVDSGLRASAKVSPTAVPRPLREAVKT